MTKILVTGSEGFVGKHLCPSLSDLNYEVIKSGPYSLNDFTDPAVSKLLIKYYRPDVVIHLAAKVGGIGANADNPGIFMRDNLTMGINLINTCLDYKISKFIMVGTVCSYPKFASIPFKEEDLWNGYPEETNAGYGIAKKTLIELIIAYNKQFGFNGINLVPVNMYGPMDNFDPKISHIIPAIILKVYKAMQNKEDNIVIWGSGKASREFLYVTDFVNAVILALTKENVSPQPINIGTGQEIKISYLVHKICDMMEYHGKVIQDVSKPDGQPRRCLCIDRARDVLGYQPTIDLDTGLRHTIDWFLSKASLMNDYLNNIQ